MNKKRSIINIKKILFLISITPYVILLILGIINCINNSMKFKYLDLNALIEPIDHFWFDTITNFNIFFICLIIFCIGYPIFYLLDKSNKQKDNTLDDKCKTKTSKFFILYIISFIPYLFLAYSCIFGIDVGFFGNTSTYYGAEAIFITIIAGCVFPIYPIILIFQIIYTLKNHKTFSKKNKKLVIGIVISIMLFTITPSIIYTSKVKVEQNKIQEEDRITIEKYLKSEFGEKHYKDMEILMYSSFCYNIKTPLLENTFQLYLDENRTQISKNYFYEDFIKQNDLNNKLSTKLATLHNLPTNVKLDLEITKVDIKNYNENDNIDSLLDACDYNIRSVTINDDYFDKDEIIQIIKNFYTEYNSIFEDNYADNWLNFYVKVQEKDYASIQVLKSSKQNTTLTLIFRGYNYGNGYTIKNDEVSIDLSL